MYISRKDALAVFGDVHPMDYNTNAYIEKIKTIPTADVVVRKHGQWKDSNYNLVWNADGVYKAAYQCSNCGACSPIAGNYCYNCGARMDGES